MHEAGVFLQSPSPRWTGGGVTLSSGTPGHTATRDAQAHTNTRLGIGKTPSAAESSSVPSPGREGAALSRHASSRLLYPVLLCGAGARWLLRSRSRVEVAAAAAAAAEAAAAAVDAVPEETTIKKTNALQPDRRQTKNSGIA